MVSHGARRTPIRLPQLGYHKHPLRLLNNWFLQIFILNISFWTSHFEHLILNISFWRLCKALLPFCLVQPRLVLQSLDFCRKSNIWSMRWKVFKFSALFAFVNVNDLIEITVLFPDHSERIWSWDFFRPLGNSDLQRLSQKRMQPKKVQVSQCVLG